MQPFQGRQRHYSALEPSSKLPVAVRIVEDNVTASPALATHAMTLVMAWMP
jgi:hypothetical protein